MSNILKSKKIKMYILFAIIPLIFGLAIICYIYKKEDNNGICVYYKVIDLKSNSPIENAWIEVSYYQYIHLPFLEHAIEYSVCDKKQSNHEGEVIFKIPSYGWGHKVWKKGYSLKEELPGNEKYHGIFVLYSND